MVLLPSPHTATKRDTRQGDGVRRRRRELDMLNNFGGIDSTNGARGGHLALVVDNNRTDGVGSATFGGARLATTSYVRGGGAEGVRGRQQMTVGAVARSHDDFESALPAMVRASGVSARAADAVTNAILNNSTLRAQAERAFRAARVGEA